MVAAHFPFLQVYILGLVWLQPGLSSVIQRKQPRGEDWRTLQHDLNSLGGRKLANAAADATDGAEMFLGVPECAPLHSIIREAPPTLDLLGNFTQEPSFSLLLDCATKRSRFILDAEQLTQAIFLPTPKVKVMQLDPLMKYVVPYQSTLFPEGTVNVVDCQDTWLDMRGWDAGEAVKAVLVALRCRMVVRDGPPFTWQTWTFNSSVHFPCNATNPIAKAGGFPKEAARFIQDTDANVGNAVLHARNQTVWCWSPQDTASIFGEEFLGSSESSFMRSAGDSFAADSSDTSQAGAVLVSCLCIAALVWIYRSDCCDRRDGQDSLQDYASNDGTTQWDTGCSRSDVQYTSTTDSRSAANFGATEPSRKQRRMTLRRAPNRRMRSSTSSRSQLPCRHMNKDQRMHGARHPRLTSASLPRGPNSSGPEAASPDTAAWVAGISENGVFKPASTTDDDSNSVSTKHSSERRSLRQGATRTRTRATVSPAAAAGANSASVCNTDTSHISKGGNTASISFGLRQDNCAKGQGVRTDTASITIGLVREKSVGSANSKQDRSGESSGSTHRSIGKNREFRGQFPGVQSTEFELQHRIERALQPSQARTHGSRALHAHHPLDEPFVQLSDPSDDSDLISNAHSVSEHSGDVDNIGLDHDDSEGSHASSEMHDSHASPWGRSSHLSAALGQSVKSPHAYGDEDSFGFTNGLPLPPAHSMRRFMKASSQRQSDPLTYMRPMRAVFPISQPPCYPFNEGSVHGLHAMGSSPGAADGRFKNVHLESADSSLWMSNPTYTGDIGLETTMSDGEGVPQETTEEATEDAETYNALVLRTDNTGSRVGGREGTYEHVRDCTSG